MSKVIFSAVPNKDKINIVFKYDTMLLGIVKELPDRKWDKKNKVWTVPLVPEIYEYSKKKFEKKFVDVEVDKSLKKELETFYEKQNKSKRDRELIENVKNTHYKKNVGLKSLLFAELFPYQKTGHEFIKATDGKCIIGDEPGVGKTIQAISYCVKYSKKTLVICPASLKYNWQQEIAKFAHKDSQVLSSGDEVDMTKQFIIINFEILQARGHKHNPERHLIRLLNKGFFDTVVIDEAHRMKNLTTGWTKWIHRNLSKVQHRILLTGTPIKSRPIEYYSLLKFIDRDRWGNRMHYGMRYCGGYAGPFGLDFTGASHLDELYEETSPYIIRRLKKDVLLELPEKTYVRTPIHMTGKEKKEYDKMFKEYKEGMKDATNKTSYSLGQLQVLKQYTSKIKVKQAKEIIGDIIASGKKIVVFSFFVDIVKEIKEHFGSDACLFIGETNLKERDKMVKDFQNTEKIKVFAATVGAAGVGLTLTASDTVLFIDLPWTPGDLQQAADRCHRVGQKNAVTIIMLECIKTVDEYISETLEHKQAVISKALDNIQHTSIATTSILRDVVEKIMSIDT